MIPRVVVIAAFAALGACKAYQMGEFTEIPITPDAYSVHFDGSAFSTLQQAKVAALVRAAELTLDKGYGRFIVLKQSSNVRHVDIVTDGQSNTSTTFSGTANTFGNTTTVFGSAFSSTNYSPPQTYTFDVP